MHLLGSTARASDIRIFLSTFIDIGFVALATYLAYEDSLKEFLVPVIAAMAYVSSHNVFFGLGIVKPFNV